MPATTNPGPGQAGLQHPHCFVCGQTNEQGMQVVFQTLGKQGVEATLVCRDEFQGYHGLLHGGLISTLLDAAMTHCLLAENIPALTAKLEVRFLRPVPVGQAITVRAHLTLVRPPYYELEAELIHGQTRAARGRGKFMQRSAQRPARRGQPGREG